MSKATGTLNKLRSVPQPRSSRRARRPAFNTLQLWQLEKATDFNKDVEIMDVILMIKTIAELEKTHPQLFEPMTAMRGEPPKEPVEGEPGPRAKRGAPRKAGDWRLIYLAMVLAREPAMLSFYSRYRSTGVFEIAGFDEMPSYQTFAVRIKEIEDSSEGFEKAANRLIRQAKRHEKRIGVIAMTDGTSWETDARLEHCCPDKEKCEALWRKQKESGEASEILAASAVDDPDPVTEASGVDESREAVAAGDVQGDKENQPAEAATGGVAYGEVGDASSADGVKSGTKAAKAKTASMKESAAKPKGKRPPTYLRRAPYERVQDERHKEADQMELEDGEMPESVVAPIDEDGRYRYFVFKGHVYRSRDAEAGVRSYAGARQEWWHGGYLMPVVDAFVGAPIAVTAFAADEQEYDHYPELNDKTVEAIGEQPLVWSFDRGTGVSGVYEFNTRRGAATVAPWKKRRGKPKREDMRTDQFDEHGIPRCPACGGEGDVDSPGMGLYFDANNDPRLRFRCQTPYLTDADSKFCNCEQIHSISCAEEWSLLVPLSRKAELYYAVRLLHGNFEGIFDHWRDRYCVAGKNATSRLKRLGVQAQLSRARAALLLDWIRVNLRHGWLGSWKNLNTKEPYVKSGAKALQRVIKSRMKQLLDLPYGSAAEKMKLAKQGSGPLAPPAVGIEDDLPF